MTQSKSNQQRGKAFDCSSSQLVQVFLHVHMLIFIAKIQNDWKAKNFYKILQISYFDLQLSLRIINYYRIKGLLEPADSCYGLMLSLYWVLGLVEFRYSWIRFMLTFKTLGVNFLLFLGSCVIRKLVHSSWWELEKRLCGLKVGWAEVVRRKSHFCWCVCVFVGRRVGWVGIIRHPMLL